MYKSLFLEGESGSGKSTLLRKLLASHMHLVGGFTSQRMVTKSGDTAAFRIGAAADTPLTMPFEGNESASGIFRFTQFANRSGKFPEVFDTLGVKYLTQNAGKKVILLDEIGGAELLSEPFSKVLYRVLGGKIPCIGVIKQERGAAFMTRTAGYSDDIVTANRELRDGITGEYSGKILAFERGDAGVENEIKEFLCGIFTTI